MRKYIAIAFLFIVFLGCEDENKPGEVCIPPSGITANENCYKLGDGLLVTATNFQRTIGGRVPWQILFHFELYPQTNSQEIDMSDPVRTWSNSPTDNVIYIPGEYLENVTLFAMSVKMLCGNSELVEGAKALFERKMINDSCYEWIITTL